MKKALQRQIHAVLFLILTLPLFFGCKNYNVPVEPYGQLHINVSPDQKKTMIKTLQLHSTRGLYIAPSIPYQKLKNSLCSCYTWPDEEIFALVDATVLGSAKNCLLVGSSGIYFHNDRPPSIGRHFWSYEEFRDVTISKNGPFDVSIGGPCFDVSGSSLSKKKVINLLHDIQSCIRGFELPNGPAEVDRIHTGREFKSNKVTFKLEADWDAAIREDTFESYMRFLEKHPNSTYKEQASTKLSKESNNYLIISLEALSIEGVQVALSAGANPDHRFKEYLTPLIYVAKNEAARISTGGLTLNLLFDGPQIEERRAIVELLIVSGANIDARDSSNKKALDYLLSTKASRKPIIFSYTDADGNRESKDVSEKEIDPELIKLFQK